MTVPLTRGVSIIILIFTGSEIFKLFPKLPHLVIDSISWESEKNEHQQLPCYPVLSVSHTVCHLIPNSWEVIPEMSIQASHPKVNLVRGVGISITRKSWENLTLSPKDRSRAPSKSQGPMVLMNLFVRQQWRNRHGEQTYERGERGGEGEMYGESNMETYTIICKIDSQWEFAVCLREFKQGFCINLEEWDGEGDEREVQEGGNICIPMTDSC